MKIEELITFAEVPEPEQNFKKHRKLVRNLLRKEFGILGSLRVTHSAKKYNKRIESEYQEITKIARSSAWYIAQEFSMLASLFHAIANRKGRKFAKNFMIRVVKNTATFALPEAYQIYDIVKCDGDVFDNFKKFNRAIFTGFHNSGSCKIDGFNESTDLLEFKINSCIIIQLFEAIGYPDLISLGCDHSLAGYPLMEEAAQFEFRRPCTLAKGGEFCLFQFYRKGKSPKKEHENK